MFHVVAGLLALYVIRRLVWRSGCSSRLRWMLALLAFLPSQHHLVTRTFFGSMSSPEVPSLVLIVLGWAFGSLILSACLLLVTDVAGLAVRRISRRAEQPLPASRARVRSAIAGAAMLLAGLGVWQSIRIPDVRTVEIELAQLPRAFDGYRMVQLSDLHASRLLQRSWMEAVVARANTLKPDLMLLTGDMVDGTVAARVHDVEPLRHLTAQHGVFAVAGNHEYYQGYQQWLTHFSTLGLRVLLNEHVTISKGDSSVVLAGVTDRAAARSGDLMPNVDMALAGVPKDIAVILLSHRPSGAQANARAGADLQLSGHTHGGQFLGFHWVVQLANEGYVSGEYTVDGMRMYVSHGAGLWNGFPIRLGRRAEITQIILRAPGGLASDL
jgi:predicted MPP superfamily phosphohydrolase